MGTDPTVFEDFEAQPSSGATSPYYWDGGPTPITASWDSSTSASCTYSFKFITGAYSGYGHWIGFSFNSPTRSYPPATTNNFSFWYKINTNVTSALTINEGSSAGGDGEAWAATVNLVSSPSWQQIVIPLSSFTSGGGNGVFDVQDIFQVWFYHSATYGPHTLYLDDLKFTP